MGLEEIVDLKRYPIDGSNVDALADLIAACKKDLAAVGASVMEGFLLTETISRIVKQVDPLAPLAFHKESNTTSTLSQMTPTSAPITHGTLKKQRPQRRLATTTSNKSPTSRRFTRTTCSSRL